MAVGLRRRRDGPARRRVHPDSRVAERRPRRHARGGWVFTFGHDYRYGTVLPVLTSVPRRTSIAAARVIGIAIWLTAVGVACVAAASVVALALGKGRFSVLQRGRCSPLLGHRRPPAVGPRNQLSHCRRRLLAAGQLHAVACDLGDVRDSVAEEGMWSNNPVGSCA